MIHLDDIDLDLVERLQEDGRLSYRELGDQVGLSAPAVRDRVRRLEDRGVITGYRAMVDYSKVGFPILAIIRLNHWTGSQTKGSQDHEGFDAALADMPELIEANRVTGSESHVVRARLTDMGHLEELFRKMWQAADSVTNVVTSSPVPRRPMQLGRALGRRD